MTQAPTTRSRLHPSESPRSGLAARSAALKLLRRGPFRARRAGSGAVGRRADAAVAPGPRLRPRPGHGDPAPPGPHRPRPGRPPEARAAGAGARSAAAGRSPRPSCWRRRPSPPSTPRSPWPPSPCAAWSTPCCAACCATGPRSEAEDLAPPWLFARWRAAWGEDAARAIAAHDRRGAGHRPFHARLGEPGAGRRLWRRRSCPAAPCAPGGAATWRPGRASPRASWWVQDAAAAIPARLLNAGPGRDVLDLCAAPGGKTLQLAAAGARVTALDRVRRPPEAPVGQPGARCGLTAEIVAADAATWPDPRDFDAVLLDAPCSATGTFRRHPDVLWNARPADIGSLAAVQAQLLAAAARRVAPGGRLVYSVCSLEQRGGRGPGARLSGPSAGVLASTPSPPARAARPPEPAPRRAGCASCRITWRAAWTASSSPGSGAGA